ncbi:MAG: LPXTG cell wall anchor domain-containing protein, partial [Microbacterium gubbeenense]
EEPTPAPTEEPTPAPTEDPPVSPEDPPSAQTPVAPESPSGAGGAGDPPHELAATGSDIGGIVAVFGALLLAAGVALSLRTRRRV